MTQAGGAVWQYPLDLRLMSVGHSEVVDGGILLEALGDATTFVAVLRHAPNEGSRRSAAVAIARSRVEVVAVWGKEAECFHDEVDARSLEVRRPYGPITAWDGESSLAEFFWLALITYRGGLSGDANNKIFVLDVRNDEMDEIDVYQLAGGVEVELTSVFKP